MSTPEEEARAKLIEAASHQATPISEIDPTAQEWDSIDGAAHAFTQHISGEQNKEQSGTIFGMPDGKYLYSIPLPAHENSFALSVKSNNQHKLVAIVHTHPGDDDLGQVFSPQDLEVANKLKLPSYVLFLKNGQLRRYTPGQTQTETLGRTHLTVAKGDAVVPPQIQKALLSQDTGVGGPPIASTAPAETVGADNGA